MSCAIGPCTHPQGESECPVCRWLLSADHSQDNDPKEPPEPEEDTLTKHDLKK